MFPANEAAWRWLSRGGMWEWVGGFQMEQASVWPGKEREREGGGNRKSTEDERKGREVRGRRKDEETVNEKREGRRMIFVFLVMMKKIVSAQKIPALM